MTQERNYQVNYTIAVDATSETKQVMTFTDLIGHLVKAKADLTPAITNIKRMMTDIDAAFRSKSGKKRDYSFKWTYIALYQFCQPIWGISQSRPPTTMSG